MKPELRFLEFEENWSYKKLKDLLKVHSGRDYKHLEPGEIPVYGTGGYMLSVSDYLSNDDAIGIGRKGTINKPYLLKAPFWTVDTLFYCTPWEEVDLYFLLSLFKKINWEKYDESTSVPSLSKVNIEKLKVYSCELEEQRKIGDFFSKLDQQIELEEQKLAKLEEQKKGYMQKVFSQELRFKDENGNDYDEWKEEKLENIADFQNGKAHENLVSIEGEYVLVNSKFISTDTRIKKHVSQQLTPLNKEDIAIVMSDIPNGKALAKCFLIDENNKYSLNQRIGRIYNILGDSRFLYLILNRNKQLLKYDSGVGQTNLKKSEITDILLNWPIKEEQQKIGDFFRKIDELIEKQANKVELLKQRKQSFLQKMFV